MTKAPRGRNYDYVEDNALSRAWVKLTSDPRETQTAERFWTKVKIEFEADPGVASLKRTGVFENRSWASLHARFSQISKAIGKLQEFIHLASQHSQTELDALSDALIKYQRANTNKRAFEFIGPYNILRKSPKFILHVEESLGKRRSQDKSTQSAMQTPKGTLESVAPGVEAMKHVKHNENLEERMCVASECLAHAGTLRTELLGILVMNEIFTAQPANEEHEEFLTVQRSLMLDSLRKKVAELRRGRSNDTDGNTTLHRPSGLLNHRWR